MENRIITAVIFLSSITMIECGKEGGPSRPSIPDPIASFTESGETVTPAVISFQNTSQNADTYLWRFGDGDSTTLTNPTHTYDVHGNYTVTLRAENTSTGRFDLKSKHIAITPGTVYIEGIRIDEMPFTDEYGAGWDLLSGPDVYADLVTSSNTILTLRPYFYLDVAPSDLPIQWLFSSGFEIANWSIVYYVQIWDYDDLGDDYIGTSNGFRINDVVSSEGYVSMVTRENSSGTIRTAVFLSWE